MKKFLFIFCTIASISCKKLPITEHPTLDVDDTIVYKIFSPSKNFQTVKFFTFQDHGICTAMVPSPTDSVIDYMIDFNQDAINDYSIVVSHHKYTSGYCGHCDIFTYNIYIEGLTANALIALNTDLLTTKIFRYSDTINQNCNYSNRAELLLLEGCALPFQTDFSSGYIGIFLDNHYGYIKIEKLDRNGLKLIEYAYNATIGRQVTCGQRE